MYAVVSVDFLVLGLIWEGDIFKHMPPGGLLLCLFDFAFLLVSRLLMDAGIIFP